MSYTIMGDTSQNIHFQYGLNDWDELRKLILTGDYDAFGLLRKGYRNTVEISAYANEILRHGDFSIYSVEPIIRHGAGGCVEPVQGESPSACGKCRRAESARRGEKPENVITRYKGL